MLSLPPRELVVHRVAAELLVPHAPPLKLTFGKFAFRGFFQRQLARAAPLNVLAQRRSVRRQHDDALSAAGNAHIPLLPIRRGAIASVSDNHGVRRLALRPVRRDGVAAHEQPQGARARLLREDPDAPRVLAICAPLTTENRGSDYEVSLGKLKFLDLESWVNVQGRTSLGHEKLVRRLGRLTARQMGQLKTALRFALDL